MGDSLRFFATTLSLAALFLPAVLSAQTGVFLTPSDLAPGDQFGFSVAISGNTSVVGSRYTDAAGAGELDFGARLKGGGFHAVAQNGRRRRITGVLADIILE